MKICTKCNLEKPAESFHKDCRYSDGRLRSHCKSCRSIERKTRYAQNKDRERHLSKEYWNLNQERMRMWLRSYYINNKNTYRENSKKFERNNPGISALYAAKRKCRINFATPSWADALSIKKIYEERKRISDETGVIHHVDHIIPLRGKLVCGLHVEYNLRIITAEENLKKNAAFIEQLL